MARFELFKFISETVLLNSSKVSIQHPRSQVVNKNLESTLESQYHAHQASRTNELKLVQETKALEKIKYREKEKERKKTQGSTKKDHLLATIVCSRPLPSSDSIPRSALVPVRGLARHTQQLNVLVPRCTCGYTHTGSQSYLLRKAACSCPVDRSTSQPSPCGHSNRVRC